MNRPEEQLQGAVLQYLRLALVPPAGVFHVPNGGGRDRREAAKLKWQGVTPGVADLILYWPAADLRTNVGAIELKAPKGRLSETQESWRLQWTACGLPWALCRSLEDVQAALRSWGCPLASSLRIAA